MRRLYIMAALLCGALTAQSQEIAKKIYLPNTQNRLLTAPGKAPQSMAKSTAVLCGVDTALYPLLKEVVVNPAPDSFFTDAMAGDVRTASQAYTITDSIDILGVQFWGGAFSSTTPPPAQTLQVMVYLYEVDAQYQPILAVDSAIVTVTENNTFYTAMFPSAHTVYQNYAVGVRSMDNAATLAITTNNADAPGQATPYGEGLAWRRFGSGVWNTAEAFFGQDLEYMIFPVVSYSITSDFAVTDDSVCIQTPQTFANMSSPVLFNRMYNLNVFDQYFGLAPADSTFRWSYGNTSDLSYTSGGAYTYTAPGNMNVMLEANLVGYFNACSEARNITVAVSDSLNITTQPMDMTVVSGGMTSFSYVASGFVSNYTWQVSTNGGLLFTTLTDGGWYSNTDTAVLDISGADQTADGYQYRAIVTGECGTDTSDVVWLSIDAPLSVSMLSFDAKQQGSSILINWTTANETNSDHFEIARSADGKEFTAIATVKSSGNSTNTNTYEVTDANPLQGYNVYRLMEYDQNGKGVSHGVRTIIIRDGAGTGISIYPNPATNSFSVATNSPAVVSITDLTGRTVKAVTIDGTTTINTDGMNSGIYLLHIQANGTKYTEKLVIDKN